MIDIKSTDGTSTSEKDQDGHGMVKSAIFLGVMNIIYLTEFFEGFRTHVAPIKVSTTGSVHTLFCCTHIFLHIARAQLHLHIFMRVHTHA